MHQREVDRQQVSSLLFSILFSLTSVLAFTATAHASLYTEKIKSFSLEKLETVFSNHDADVSCLSTPENPFLIGMVHQILIHAPIEKVISVFESFEDYPQIFDGLKRVKLLEKNESKNFLVEFESIIPIPFVPNSVYQVWYRAKVEELPVYKKSYLFELKSGNDLKALDGVAVIKKIGPSETLYQEVDFLDVNWGLAKTFAAKSIWPDTVTDTIRSDYGLKFKSESSAMDSREIKKQSRFSVEAKKIEDCVAHQKPASTLFSTSKK